MAITGEQRVDIILNPAAAKGKAISLKGRIENTMRSLGINHRIFCTERVWHAAELAKRSVEDQVDVIVAAGGDGTCNEVVNGMMAAAEAGNVLPELAVFPIGRGNDFAYMFDIPKKVEDFCSLLINGESTPIDIGSIVGGIYPEGRYFINGTGIGFEPMVTIKASEFTRVSGVPSYILALIHVLKDYPKAVDVVISVDGKQQTLATQQISICNGKRMGGAFLMGPEADISDGLLDLNYVNRPLRGSQILRLVGRFLSGSQIRHPSITAERARHISIHAGSGGLVCHADGEIIAFDTDHLEVDVCPGAIRLIHSGTI